jgi:hypothetical protein
VGVSRDELLTSAVKEALGAIQQFAESPEFMAVLGELWSEPEPRRADFVSKVLLHPESLLRRGVVVPEGILLQRSWFRDNRPTLFCLTMHLADGLPWHKVTITFDNEFGEPAVKYEDVVSANGQGGQRDG